MERRQTVWATPRAVVPAGVQEESGQFNSRPPGPACIHDPLILLDQECRMRRDARASLPSSIPLLPAVAQRSVGTPAG